MMDGCGIDSPDLNPIKRIQRKASKRVLEATSRQRHRPLPQSLRIPRQPNTGKQIDKFPECHRPHREGRLGHRTVTQFIAGEGVAVLDRSVGRLPGHDALPGTVSRAVPVGCHVGRRCRINRQARRRGWRRDYCGTRPTGPGRVTPVRASFLSAAAVLGEPLLVIYTLRVAGTHIIIVKMRACTVREATMLQQIRGVVVRGTEDKHAIVRPAADYGLQRAGAIGVLVNRDT